LFRIPSAAAFGYGWPNNPGGSVRYTILLSLAFGCATHGTVRGPPVALLPAEGAANSDAVWVVVPIAVPVSAKYGTSTAPEYQQFYGIFACYRPPAESPGTPDCFLARMEGDLDDLSWPGNVQVERGVLHRDYSAKGRVK
jgi:hypothetical protein